MPIYDYKCSNCNKEFEEMQSFSDAPITDCPYCKAKGTVKKVIAEPAVLFKGSGFYCTDNHSASGCSGKCNCEHKN
jgi:putative regulatory protein, FmdB family